MRTAISLILLAGALGSGAAYAKNPAARATLADAKGAPVAHAAFTQTKAGLRLVVDAAGLPAGAHGIHIHAVGQCAAPDFKTAGGHWNPMGKTHGMESPGGMHQGDLPNLIVAANGKGHLDTLVKGGALTGPDALLDADGAALVIHADADDYRTDPAGNSGARIACGVIEAS